MPILNISFLKRKRLSAVLGLSLDGGRLEGVVLRRNNGSLLLQQSFSVALSLDPLTAPPELVGREIRNHLDAAGIRERHCVVGLPLKWALTAQTEVPEMPDKDVPGFLQIEAERGFPSDVATLHFSASRCRTGSGKQIAMMVGIPRSHLALLEQVLRSAKLKPVSFSLGIAALQPPAADKTGGVLALAVGETTVGLQVTSGGGVAALRALEGALELAAGRRELHADLVAREARITLGQLPTEVRESVRRVRIFGPRDLAQQLADEIELRLEPMGLKVEQVKHYPPGEFGVQLPPEAVVSPAFSLAAEHLVGRAVPFELLPPRVTAWQQVTTRYSSGRLRFVSAGAAALLLIVGAAFGYQQWELNRLGSRWAGMVGKKKELDKLQEQIRQFRPWYDDNLGGLSILKQLTSAFPSTGDVSAKSVEIRDLNTVTCTGTAKDNQSLLKVTENLRKAGISDVKVDMIRGRAPALQFTFDFHWNEGGKRAN
jgi:hypothetical protein